MIARAKKILVVTPSFPFPATGAEQADRAWGLVHLKNLGYEVKVIAKLVAWRDSDFVKEMEQNLGIDIIAVPYKYSNRILTLSERLKQVLLKIRNPFLLDGAALEYAEPEMKKALEREVREWRPDYVWFDYTYLWPLYKIIQKEKIPIITRSINFEPLHFLQEDGLGPFHLIKSIPKFVSEFLSARKSEHVFAITPKEEKIYRLFGAKSVSALPLRGLPYCLKTSHSIQQKENLNVFFMGSTYNVSHNKSALELIIKNIAPYMHRSYPGRFTFYILGRKIPEGYEKYFKDNVIYQGPTYGEELEKFFLKMDIALIPSLFGAGMQQKIFEPLCRGIPTITSSRGIAGYPFKDRTHLYCAENLNEFVSALGELRDVKIRERLSHESISLASKIFSRAALDSIVQSALNLLP